MSAAGRLNSGTFTLIANSYYDTGAGTYTVRLSRVAPDLIVPETQTIDELTSLNISISAVDPEIPAKPLAFELLSAPAGAVLTTASATNAAISWATTEATGPSTNLFVARVTDIVDGTAYQRTNSFEVIVRELNTRRNSPRPPRRRLMN